MPCGYPDIQDILILLGHLKAVLFEAVEARLAAPVCSQALGRVDSPLGWHFTQQ